MQPVKARSKDLTKDKIKRRFSQWR